MEPVMDEQRLSCVVEAVGRVVWPDGKSDPRWDEPMPLARVLAEDGMRYFVNPGQCYRNGTTLNESIVGETGTIEVYRHSVIAFNCPTLFKR